MNLCQLLLNLCIDSFLVLEYHAVMHLLLAMFSQTKYGSSTRNDT